jgi:hypothetical protein
MTGNVRFSSGRLATDERPFCKFERFDVFSSALIVAVLVSKTLTSFIRNIAFGEKSARCMPEASFYDIQSRERKFIRDQSC